MFLTTAPELMTNALGRPAIGDGANGYANAQGGETAGGDGGRLRDNGGNGSAIRPPGVMT